MELIPKINTENIIYAIVMSISTLLIGGWVVYKYGYKNRNYKQKDWYNPFAYFDKLDSIIQRIRNSPKNTSGNNCRQAKNSSQKPFTHELSNTTKSERCLIELYIVNENF